MVPGCALIVAAQLVQAATSVACGSRSSDTASIGSAQSGRRRTTAAAIGAARRTRNEDSESSRSRTSPGPGVVAGVDCLRFTGVRELDKWLRSDSWRRCRCRPFELCDDPRPTLLHFDETAVLDKTATRTHRRRNGKRLMLG